jgi:membrane associated rhomboid family serine protease
MLVKGQGGRLLRNEWNEPEMRSGSWKDRLSPNLPVSCSGLILIICIVLFFLGSVIPGLNYYLILHTDYVMQQPWSLLTHMFMHANFDHLFWNMIVLFFFGTELERRVGEKKFLQIYIISGIVAALGQMLIAGGSMLGASGALYGVMGCLAIIAPEIRVLLFFVVPLSIRSAVVLFAVIDFLTMGSADNIAHMAHISGLLVGLAYGQAMMRTPKYYYEL